MAMTLVDYAAQIDDKKVRGVIKTFFKDSLNGGGNLLKVIPIVSQDALTATYPKVNTEGSTSGVGSRAIGSAYPEGTMTIYQESVNIGNIGGRIAIDEAFLISKGYVSGAEPKVLQTAMKSALINRQVNNGIINGDRSSNPNFFNGLRKWVDSTQVLTPDTTTYANGLTVATSTTTQKAYLRAIDDLVDAVGGRNNPNVYIILNDQARKAYRNAVQDLGWFGTSGQYYDKTIESYGGVGFLNPGSKTSVEGWTTARNNTNAVIPNNFTYGSATTATEIWAIRCDPEDGLALNQLRPLHVREIGMLEAAPQEVVEIDWWVALYPRTKNCIAKLSGCIVV